MARRSSGSSSTIRASCRLARRSSIRWAPRIRSLRARLAAFDPRLAYIGEQNGMFSMLPLSPAQVLALREQHGIYMAGSGRFNVVGLSDESVDRFAAAVVEMMPEFADA
jgi:aromatic-amino-acid transaminase